MTLTTYYINYAATTQGNSVNAINTWLNQLYKTIYIRESSWFVVTNLSASDIRDYLLVLINADDHLLIFAVGTEWSTWGLDEKINYWLKDTGAPDYSLLGRR